MNTQNPFDLSAFFKPFDAADMTKQYQALFSSFTMPNIDMTGLMEAQNKNLQALTSANRAVLEGTQALMQRQAEMVRQMVEEASEAAKSMGGTADPKEAAEKQIKLIEGSFSEALANFAEISEMVKKTQDEATQLVTTRFNESLSELREGVERMKSEGGKDAG